jgi:hypothetical protein
MEHLPLRWALRLVQSEQDTDLFHPVLAHSLLGETCVYTYLQSIPVPVVSPVNMLHAKTCLDHTQGNQHPSWDAGVFGQLMKAEHSTFGKG